MGRKFRPYLIFVFFLLFLCRASSASSFEGPLPIKNDFPLFLHLDAPSLESASTGNSFSAALSHSSVFMLKQSPDWSVNLDMEVTDLTLRLRKDFPRLFEIGVDLPVLVFSSGFMDSFLDGYHGAFGFPDYGRSARPANEFLYYLKKGGAPIIRGRNGLIGLGDIRLSSKKKIFEGDPVISIRTDLELPTGRASEGFGNGSLDAGLAILVDKKLSEKFISYWNAGVVFPGDLKAIETVGTKTFPYAGAGIEAALWQHFSLNGQVFFQGSPFPKTEIPGVDRIAALLSLGGSYSCGGNSLEMSLTEDPNTAGAPDVSFSFSFRRKF